ncbi:MAG: LysE family translocator [Rhodospirillaceae bacterium]|jgi:threonine/homoserine/homoserine lactone efflux protein|nr:LysE family translocator [Rhodospirillaceae bacterium]
MSDLLIFTIPIDALLQLVAASVIVKVTPGPGVAATVARSMAQGLRPALANVLGIVIAEIALVLLCLTGLAALATHFEGFFTALRYLGAAYLIYLGYRFWVTEVQPATVEVKSKGDLMKAALSGFTLTMSNPKAIIFYAALLPLFIDIGTITLADGALVLGLMVFDIAIILTGYAVLASRARNLLGSSQHLRWFNRAAGTAMLGAGGIVAAQ